MYISSGKDLFAIDLESPQKVWQFETGGPIRSSAAVADGYIYVGSGDGRLYALDVVTGEKLWDFLTEDEITSSPAIANGTVYIGSHDGNLYAIE
ncbi:unnamed protein product [marine sediment metagenome]|uniref:Pyrrolo-quinoline quinone repeat domain-containing protein n=1 Tax=marine sediment metagenome TaxID=412755 RepID=X0Y6R9_9ZZZZ